jgi:hypothetical protein
MIELVGRTKVPHPGSPPLRYGFFLLTVVLLADLISVNCKLLEKLDWGGRDRSRISSPGGMRTDHGLHFGSWQLTLHVF